MKSYEWKRISESHEDSSHTYRYACEDFPSVTITVIESQAISSDRGKTLQKAKTFIESGAFAKAAQELESMKKSKGPFS